ncbi:GmrSD restriction endonuclease domain-containing protein [Streptomyces yunnanensis]|uniref:GmrSD restriction endonucleases C-terminal domain-containing protein n=1 Tax=Streptomyces yunnanensis TaxID=156453 RepID=A0A9X8QUM9_9ACTN|nr:DUF1524 domain-containing protein [Streptomyces noursei]SHM24556.1 Protein of unknown function [Streptomyces yunnanensis]
MKARWFPPGLHSSRSRSRSQAEHSPQAQREALANDPLNLVAADGPANMGKGDKDAASWLPANKTFDCTYVARQIAGDMPCTEASD